MSIKVDGSVIRDVRFGYGDKDMDDLKAQILMLELNGEYECADVLRLELEELEWQSMN